MNHNLGDSIRMAAFEIWSDYGHFRRGYTTTSPLTYPFPSRTTIAGIVAAVLGLPRDSYYEEFNEENSAVSLQILNPIKKTTINQNLVDTKTGFYLWDNGGQRTQIPYEFLKNPRYRLFVWLRSNSLMERLCNMIPHRKTVFTLYMGISEHIAQYKPYKGGCVVANRKIAKEPTLIHSVVPNNGTKLVIEPQKSEYVYGYVKVPGFMSRDRIVKKYIELYYEESGKPLKIMNGEYYAVEGDINIVPF